MSRKRARERPAVDTQLVEIYEDLASLDESIRLKAACSLLKNFISNKDISSEQISQIFDRLFRGICSGRKAARLGFSIALTEGLSEVFQGDKKHPSVFENAHQVVELIRTSTRVSGGAESQEDRDHQLGRLFGADAILKSRILFDLETGLSAWNEVLDLILVLAKKKTWLREQCGFVLYQSAIRLGSEHGRSPYAQAIIDKFQSNKLLKTSEGVAIWIELQTNFPSLSFPKGVWHNDNPLDRNNLPKLASILRESSQKQEENAPSQPADITLPKGFWSANLHFAWTAIIQTLASRPWFSDQNQPSESGSIDLDQFWLECVDNGLFNSSSSKERKYWGLLLLQHVLSFASSLQQFSTIFSPNVMHCLVDHLSASERYLYPAAEKTCKAIIDRASTDTGCQAAIVGAVLRPSISIAGIDLLSRNQDVEGLLTGLDEDDATDILLKMETLLFHQDASQVKIATIIQKKVVELLATALRNTLIEMHATDPRSIEVDGYIQKLLNFLATHAYFETSARPVNTNSDKVDATQSSIHDTFKSRLSSCLIEILSKTKNPSLYVVDLVRSIREQSHNSSGIPLLQSEGHLQDVMDETWRIVEFMHSKDPGKSDQLHQSAELLLCLTYLQIHDGEPDAVNVLEELNECFSEEQLKQYSAQSFIIPEALIEIIITLVSKPSQLYRRLACQVFETYAPFIDSTCLKSMSKVLETKENLAGQMDIFEQDEDDDDDQDEEGGEEEEDDDEESSSDADGTPSDVEETSAVGSDDDEELAAFEAKLAQALGTRPGREDADASDNNSSAPSSAPSSDMNDSDMEALDMQLTTVFRERKKLITNTASKKKQHKAARTNMIDFKCRILDLLSIFIKTQLHTTLALTILLPVLTLLRTTSSPLIIKKSRNLIQEYARRARGKKLPTLSTTTTEDDIFPLLRAVHGELAQQKRSSNAHTAACSQASLLLVRVLVRHHGNDRERDECLQRIDRMYADTKKKVVVLDKVRKTFFEDWDHWCASAGAAVGAVAGADGDVEKEEGKGKGKGKKKNKKVSA